MYSDDKGRKPDMPPPGAGAGADPAGIPTDWDAFAIPATNARVVRPPRPQARGAPTPLGGTGMGHENSIDALFGLRPGDGGDPLADSPLAAPMTGPNTAAAADPLRSLDRVPEATMAALPDDLSDLRRPFPPRSARAAPGEPAPAAITALMAAFGEGLGVPGLAPETLTPDWMRMVGQHLRAQDGGTGFLAAHQHHQHQLARRSPPGPDSENGTA